MDELFGKYCYIDTPWIAGKKTRYRIIGSGVKSNTWCEVPVTGRIELVMHDHREDVVHVVLDTLVSDDSIIRRFAMKDIEIIKPSAEPERKTVEQQPPYVAEIEEEYKKAVNAKWIRKPLAKALYEVWKKHDREDAERRTDD